MKSYLLALTIFFPTAALADLSESTILQANSSLNLETGGVGASGSAGADLVWTGSIFNLQSGVKTADVGSGGQAAFDVFTLALLNTFVSGAKATSIPAANLVPGEIFLVVDHAGHVSKVLVLAVNGGSILIRFLTYAAPAATVPVITDVLNNSSQTPFGYPNYGIAPSSIFVIQGSSLADAGTPVLQSSADPGLSTTLNGASLTVVVNGVTTHPPIYYTSPGQIAAVLPAATPIGIGTITVTYRGNTSAPMQIQVVPSALGFNFYYTNTAVATDAITGVLLTYTSSGKPGEVITLWATGLGADPADSDSIYTSSPHAVNTPLQVYIGGVQATILYQGSAGYPGVNQINVTIPATVPPGCFVNIVAVGGGNTSNTASIPINSGGGACVDGPSRLTGNQILGPNNQVLRTGLVSLIQTNTPSKTGRSLTNSANAAFVSYTGLYSPGNPVSNGGCILNDENIVPVPPVVGLDVGTIELTGPNGLDVVLKSQGIQGTGFANLSATAIPATGGSFTFKMSGGKDVAGFSTTIVMANPTLNWTNQNVAATIDRSQPLTVTWTGGNTGPHAYTFILGSSGGGVRGRGFTCLTTADTGQFTVPSYILSALPPGTSGIILQNSVQQPIGSQGLDIGSAVGQVSYTVTGTLK